MGAVVTDVAPIRTAMLVDDEALDQRHYRRVLERSGLVGEVISFIYPDEALDYLRRMDRPEIDLLFLDINMPRLNGFEFLETATQEFGPDFARTVVIMLTTSLDPGDEARAKSFSVVRDFINKPLTADHVQSAAQMVACGQGPA